VSPSKPQDPEKGKAAESEQIAAEAAEAKEAEAKAEEAKPRRRRAKKDADAPRPRRRRARKAAPEAEGSAAEETEVEKEGAAAATAEAPAKAPGKRRRGAKADAGADQKVPELEAERSKDEKKEEKAAAPPSTPAPSTRRRRAGARPPGAPPLVRARARYVRTSPRKARLMCEHIRGKPVPEARAILAFAPRAAARDWARLLDSAVANAENNHELVGDELRVTQAIADEGPTLKRYRPRAMGRATQIRKRTSHLTITLAPEEE